MEEITTSIERSLSALDTTDRQEPERRQATFMRIGNDEYAWDNQSFSMITLQNCDEKIDGVDIKFHFHGKSGIPDAMNLSQFNVFLSWFSCHRCPADLSGWRS